MIPRTVSLFVRSLEVTNIRGFKRLRLPLAKDQGLGMLTTIVGKNGTCKSTLLRCLALGLVRNQDDAAKLLVDSPGQLVRAGAKGKSEIRVELGRPGGDESVASVTVCLTAQGEVDVIDRFERSPEDLGELFACGYGPGRALPGTGSRQGGRYRAQSSLMSLFSYNVSMQHPELMLRRLRDSLGSRSYTRVMKGLKRILGLTPSQRIELPKGGGVRITGRELGAGIPLEGWADGYRMTINWLLDFYGWAILAEAVDESGHVGGILLLDEAEQHLHPSMQADLLIDLRKAFPNVQILSTTHSPLTALGGGSEGLVALHRRGQQVQAEVAPSLQALSAEDVLTHDALFDTSPYPSPTRHKIDEYQKLFKKGHKRSKQEDARMRRLAVELDAATEDVVLELGRDDRKAEMRRLMDEALKNRAEEDL